MLTIRSSHGTDRRGSLRRTAPLGTVAKAGVTVLVAFSILVAAAPAAPAVTLDSAWGSPGYTTLPVTYGSWSWSSGGTVWVPGRTVVESPVYASREQAVCVRPALWKLVDGTMVTNKSWSLANSGWSLRQCRIISASARTTTVSGGAFLELDYGSEYAITVNVAWYVRNSSGSWVTVGTKVYDYNATGDYRCSSGGCFVKHVDGFGAVLHLG